MEIVKEGNGQDWHLTLKCEVVKDKYGLDYDGDKEHCGSELKIDKTDIMIRKWEKYLYQASGTDYVVKCPKCGCCLYIKPDLLPEWVKTQAKERPYRKYA